MILNQYNDEMEIVNIRKTTKITNNFNILRKNSLGINIPNKNLIISDLHIVKQGNRMYLPRTSNKFKKLPSQEIEFYHIETKNYINDWFTANNLLVETFSSGEHISHLEERMKRIKKINKRSKAL